MITKEIQIFNIIKINIILDKQAKMEEKIKKMKTHFNG